VVAGLASGFVASSGKAVYAEMLKRVISPRLRALGFTGSAGSYRWPSETHWAQIGFQKSRSGTAEDVRFTCNVSVLEKREWDAMRRAYPGARGRPAPNTRYQAPHWSERIGFVAGAQKDLWWRVDRRTDIVSLGDDVVSLIERYGLPALRSRLGGEGPAAL
jgi:Domain of unknown function (DUF4304)